MCVHVGGIPHFYFILEEEDFNDIRALQDRVTLHFHIAVQDFLNLKFPC